MDIFRRCLAVLNNNKKKKKQLNQNEEQSTQNLSDAIVCLIVLRLPLRYAIQCKTLNKNLYAHISDPTFNHKHALISSSSQISHTVLYKPSARLWQSVPSPKLIYKGKVSVLSSSNGLLLVYVKSSNIPYYVFNPITGQALAVHHQIPQSNGTKIGPPGLVVDLGDNETRPFTIVMTSITNERLRFEVIIPSGSSTTLKSSVDFICDTFTWIDNRSLYFRPTLHDEYQTRPVYLNGSLHWLGENLSNILAFNLEKEEAKVINGPAGLVIEGSITSWLCIWFGSVKGSLSFVSTSWVGVNIHVHDYENDLWRIQYRIENKVNPVYRRFMNPGMPLFFDGENLFFQLHEMKGREHTYHIDELYVYKISRRMWEYRKSERPFRMSPFHRPFVPFLPTLIEVFDSDDDHLQKMCKGLKIKGVDDADIKVVSKSLYKLQQKFLRLKTDLEYKTTQQWDFNVYLV